MFNCKYLINIKCNFVCVTAKSVRLLSVIFCLLPVSHSPVSLVLLSRRVLAHCLDSIGFTSDVSGYMAGTAFFRAALNATVDAQNSSQSPHGAELRKLTSI